MGSLIQEIDGGVEYDTQYIQAGWGLTKSYGNAAPALGMLGYAGIIVHLGKSLEKIGILSESGPCFKKENLVPNLRGLALGQIAANGFKKN